tara:strand:+ start:234 stop:1130 length:897 start_codon:yes stop_codon:yes gene_type:complete
MATAVNELWQGYSGNQDSATILYLVEGASSWQNAMDLLEGAASPASGSSAPTEFDNMPRDNVSCKEVDLSTGLYSGRATYKRGPKKSQQETGTSPTTDGTANNNGTFSFEVALDTVSVREPIRDYVEGTALVDREPQKYFPAAGEPKVEHEGLNYEDGAYQGADVFRPSGSFSFDYYPSNSTCTHSYQTTVMNSVGKLNSDSFRGYAAGELLFWSCRGQSRNDRDWKLNLTFRVSPNVSSKKLAGIDVTNVGGWDYQWVHYVERIVDHGGGQKTAVSVPVQANLAVVYESTAFSALFP